MRGIGEAFCLKPFAEERVFFCRCRSHSWELPLEVTEALGLLRRGRVSAQKKEQEGETRLHGRP